MYPQPRVAPGYALFTVGDRWVVRDPAGAMAAVRADVVAGLAAPSDLNTPEAEAAVHALQQAGVLQDADVATTGTEAARVTIRGPAAIVDPLSDLLRTGGHQLASPDTEPTDASVMSWCGSVPAAAARVLDGRCAAGDVIWQRCAVEGGLALIEPLGYGATPVTHAMVRARRLAAAEHPDALLASWSDSGLHGPDLLGPTAAAFLAALLAHDLVTALAGDPPPRLTRMLRVVDLTSLTVTEHPILPVPDCDWRMPSDA